MNKGNIFDAVVVGAGHAGIEAALALARTHCKTLLVTLSLDAVAFMPCNPSIGGTAKGHLVREIDALGGQMGIAADNNLLQLRMLNTGKGPAVRSLRAQADKKSYHTYMKRLLENQDNLTLLQGEVAKLIVEGGRVHGIETAMGQTFLCDAIVLAAGVYLNAEIIVGEFRQNVGPNNFAAADFLTPSLKRLDIPTRRFKTGTPARVDGESLDYSVMEIQSGDEELYPFSFMNDGFIENKAPCYLTYTTQKTKDIIMANVGRSPLFNGSIKSVGPRYCPSIEDKVVRFADKERHQIFIEPESLDTGEMYVQGMSSSMPFDVQLEMYKSVVGLEHVRIMRYAYAIEYDCLDSLCLDASLMVKHIQGLFSAGQLNGSSGYEEAAAQGLMAGINASRFIHGQTKAVLGRDEAYIGVLIDDLVTKGTNEPYRMMTARAEYRLRLRQENADERLTPHGREWGLVDDARYVRFEAKRREIKRITAAFDTSVGRSTVNALFQAAETETPNCGMKLCDIVKRKEITAKTLSQNVEILRGADIRALEECMTRARYAGYLAKEDEAVAENKRLEDVALPLDTDYKSIGGLRLEAAQKLDAVRPLNLGQASRISGVSPADITVLIVCLAKGRRGAERRETDIQGAADSAEEEK